MDFLKCNICKQSKHPSLFDRYRKGSEKRQGYCKDCRVVFQREYYKKNPKKKIAQCTVAGTLKRKELASEVHELKKKPCVDCHQRFHPCAMDFDHRDPKEKVSDITSLIKRRVTREKLYSEIEKCDLVCANCHRVRTAKSYGKFVPVA